MRRIKSNRFILTWPEKATGNLPVVKRAVYAGAAKIAACRIGNDCARRQGFTLIELLVVVLIIGILSAVALLQYEKAVVKSRASTMLASLRALATAQEAYRLANGDYAARYDQLDLSFDSLPDKNPADGRGYLTPASSDAVRANKHFKLVINGNGAFLHSTAVFLNGTYEGAGLLIAHYVTNLGGVEKDILYCFEYSRVKGNFCKPFYGAVLVGNANSIDYYKMP